uniref:Uncharacterized protein n=1 Tax=Romanomermis culicivorax TaxID=13658 RepID=A0A915L764_ROMCU
MNDVNDASCDDACGFEEFRIFEIRLFHLKNLTVSQRSVARCISKSTSLFESLNSDKPICSDAQPKFSSEDVQAKIG